MLLRKQRDEQLSDLLKRFAKRDMERLSENFEAIAAGKVMGVIMHILITHPH